MVIVVISYIIIELFLLEHLAFMIFMILRIVNAIIAAISFDECDICVQAAISEQWLV